VKLLICYGLASLFYGAYCLVVSSWAVETSHGYFVRLFHTTFKIDDHGMLGDDGTFRTELAMKGIFFAATSLAAFIYATKIMKACNREKRHQGLSSEFSGHGPPVH
jgi:hypothetical protein